MRIFYCLYFFFFLQYENFINGMINRTPSVSSTSHKNTSEEKGKTKMLEENISLTNLERNGKKILFVSRNVHFSNYQIFVNLANKLNDSGYIVQVRYVLVNQHPLVQFHIRNWSPSPSPYVKFIGGIHVEEFAHKMKEDSNRQLLYSKSDCLVLFSIGTLKSISQQGSKFVNIILNVFGAYPKCHFIVSNFDEKNMSAHERKQILQHTKNIEIVQGFVQQREILAQPNLRLFISHCGQNSLNEAVYLGVPIIYIPFSFDQFHNAAIVEFLGNGKFLKNDTVGATLPEALNEMLEINDNKYRIIAQKLKEMIMDYTKRSDEFNSVVGKAILELEQNQKPNLAVKSITGGWTFDNPSLDDNFVDNFVLKGKN